MTEKDRGIDPKPWWPVERIAESSWSWGADEMKEEMTACPDCGRGDTCSYHQAMVEGYSKGMSDVSRLYKHDGIPTPDDEQDGEQDAQNGGGGE